VVCARSPSSRSGPKVPERTSTSSEVSSDVDDARQSAEIKETPPKTGTDPPHTPLRPPATVTAHAPVAGGHHGGDLVTILRPGDGGGPVPPPRRDGPADRQRPPVSSVLCSRLVVGVPLPRRHPQPPEQGLVDRDMRAAESFAHLRPRAVDGVGGVGELTGPVRPIPALGVAPASLAPAPVDHAPFRLGPARSPRSPRLGVGTPGVPPAAAPPARYPVPTLWSAVARPSVSSDCAPAMVCRPTGTGEIVGDLAAKARPWAAASRPTSRAPGPINVGHGTRRNGGGRGAVQDGTGATAQHVGQRERHLVAHRVHRLRPEIRSPVTRARQARAAPRRSARTEGASSPKRATRCASVPSPTWRRLGCLRTGHVPPGAPAPGVAAAGDTPLGAGAGISPSGQLGDHGPVTVSSPSCKYVVSLPPVTVNQPRPGRCGRVAARQVRVRTSADCPDEVGGRGGDAGGPGYR